MCNMFLVCKLVKGISLISPLNFTAMNTQNHSEAQCHGKVMLISSHGPLDLSHNMYLEARQSDSK